MATLYFVQQTKLFHETWRAPGSFVDLVLFSSDTYGAVSEQLGSATKDLVIVMETV